MEENTKDSCCANGKCLCHKKWVKISLAVASGLVIFLLGIALGSCHRGYGDRNFRGGDEQFGRGNGGCPMMRGENRGTIKQEDIDPASVQNIQATQKSPSSIKIQVAPATQATPTLTPTPAANTGANK